MKTKARKKLTVRGYQTALGIAMSKVARLQKELAQARREAELARNERRAALECVRHLRKVLGEEDPVLWTLKYDCFRTEVVLDKEDFRPIPPIHIHIRADPENYGMFKAVKYGFDLFVPEGRILDYRTARVIHSKLHELVDFVEKHPYAGCPRKSVRKNDADAKMAIRKKRSRAADAKHRAKVAADETLRESERKRKREWMRKWRAEKSAKRRLASSNPIEAKWEKVAAGGPKSVAKYMKSAPEAEKKRFLHWYGKKMNWIDSTGSRKFQPPPDADVAVDDDDFFFS